jgi:hypothetical protein
MKNPFATDNVVGQPLDAPSTQTILPVICGGNGNIRGWLTIQSTTFDGTETSFTTSDGAIPITTVTLPKLVVNDDLKHRVFQYMAAVFPDSQEHLRPWLGYSAFVSADESQYAMQWFMPTVGQGYRLNIGPLFTDLSVRMDADQGTVPAVPPAPSVTPGTLRWALSMTMNDLSASCGFFDFNWVNLFKAQSQNQPLRIETVSNPSSGEFKTTLVPYPTTIGAGAIEFNTLRIIKLKPVAAGTYVFHYQVVDQHGQATPVTLTLTVV